MPVQIRRSNLIPDITMCKYECPKHKSCYRFIAKPSVYWQAYFASEPWETSTPKTKLTISSLRDNTPEGFHCKHYWPQKINFRPKKKKKKKK